ncbi:unnamed protein product [Oikopleura dioica]|uniref:Reticulocalbin-3 n=1 Tax=Oikopleura dioica TaxID=34765 RepID=E4WSE1_OIKDI|nr:unnamed protein product [Oikopleura dioica]
MRNFLVLPYVALTSDFAHLEGMVSKEELRLLNSLKDTDKKRMMERIFEDMDADADNYLEPNELHTWIHYLEQIRVDEDVHQQLPHFDINNDGFLDFNEYNDKMMEIINNPETLKTLTEEEQEALRADNQRNTRRFLEADKNQDGQLDREEFGAFLHPHTAEWMQRCLAIEALEAMDTNENGLVDEDEFLKHVIGDAKTVNEQWLDQERRKFKENLDIDPADGQLDADEIIRFISPENGNHIEMEVNNLVHQTDKDDDLRLSKEEVLANYRHFFASQATEWGKRILTHHDEL